MKTKLTLFIISILLLTLACQHQKQNAIVQEPSTIFIQDTIFADKIKKQTDSFANAIEAQNYQTVILKGEQFLTQFEDSLKYDSVGWAMLNHRLGVAYSRIKPQSPDFCKKMEARFYKAIELRQRLLKDSANLANSYLHLGLGENEYEKHKESITNFNKVFHYYTEKDFSRYIIVRRELLRAYSELGDYKLAEKNFQIVQQYYQKLKTPSSNVQSDYAGVFLYVGDYYRDKKDYPNAIKSYSAGRDLYIKNEKEYYANICNLRLNYVLMKTKQNISTINQIIPYFIKTKDNTNLVQSYIQLSNCYISLGKYSQAILFSKQKAAPIIEKLQDKIIVGNHYFVLAKAYLNNKDYQNALKNNDKALQSYLLDFNENDITKNLRRCQEKSILADVFLQKAEAFTKLAEQTNSTADLQNAWRTYQTLSSLFDFIQEDILTEGSKFDLAKKKTWVADALAVAKKLAAKTGDSTFEKEAYYMVQNAKAQVILEHQQGEKGKIIANIPDSLIEQERILVADLAELYRQKYDNPNTKDIDNQILAAEAKNSKFIKELEQKYPLYYNAKYNHNPLTIKEIKSRLKPKMAVVDYFLTKDSLHIFVTNREKFTWKTVAIFPSDSCDAFTFQSVLNNTEPQYDSLEIVNILKYSHRLYQTLIAPIQNEINNHTRLRIVSFGWLNRVVFPALTTKEYTGKWTDLKTPFLIKEYALSHLFNVKELEDFKEKRSFNGIVNVLSFGNSYNDEKTLNPNRNGDTCLARTLLNLRGGGKLPYATKEAEAVKTLWGTGNCFLDKDANKKNFINQCKTNPYNILHLAMHGVRECDNPDNIQLIFAKNKENEDNIMRMSEIAGMEMRCDLAVLSACHSGEGRLDNHEGIISLARTFAMSGCQSLVTSKSYVDDFASPKIFENFYENLKDNDLDKDVALKKAICKYIDNCKDYEREPYRWANFQLWGNVDAIESDDFGFYKKWWFWAALSVIGLLVYWRKKLFMNHLK